jgi:plastocyanin
MRKIWFGLLGITTGAGAIAIGCGDTPQSSTGAGGGSSTASSSSSSVTAGSGSTSGSTSGSGSGSTSGSGSGSSSSSAGSGGAGGGGGCSLPTDCPGTDTDCQQRTCTQGVCGLANAPSGTATTAQAAGDCKKSVCDGQGAVKTVNDDTDNPNDGKQCTADVCVSGAPSNPNLVLGLPCAEAGGHYCDGAGKCVECLKNADCTSGFCQANVCVVGSCTNGMKDGGETDIDCGGPLCNDCVDGKACAANNDCTSSVCTNSVCQPPSCTDFTKNGVETDVDCGGPVCGKCSDGKLCSSGNDCTSKVCAGAPLSCQAPSCTDTVKNGAETDVDCGGACAQKCAAGKGCGINTDCVGGVCNQNTKVCDPSCTDGTQNGGETDVDCGSVCATQCGLGQGCAKAADCTTAICTDGACAQINGCDLSNAQDFTNVSSVSIAFGGLLGIIYKPKCIKVSEGTLVTFNGSFLGHPLVAGEVQGNVEIPAQAGTTPLPLSPGLNSGSTATFTMAPIGTYPYYCLPHGTFGMNGTIFVVP